MVVNIYKKSRYFSDITYIFIYWRNKRKMTKFIHISEIILAFIIMYKKEHMYSIYF